jgi:hypothetical protein
VAAVLFCLCGGGFALLTVGWLLLHVMRPAPESMPATMVMPPAIIKTDPLLSLKDLLDPADSKAKLVADLAAVQNKAQRDDALDRLAQEAVSRGDLSVMKTTLGDIRGDWRHDRAAEACVFWLIAEGKDAEAEKFAKEIYDPSKREDILRKLATGTLTR